MESFRTKVRQATGETSRDQLTLPGVIVIAQNATETLNLGESFGFQSLSKNSPSIDFDSTFWIASCTKLATTVAALQIVEKGLVTLDEDITRVLHEWRGQKVLVGFGERGEPVLREAKNKMTMRQLLTHSAGMAYDQWGPKAQAYRKATNTPIGGNAPTLAERSLFPFMYEPGEGWDYSPSIDWAGVVVERLGGSDSLESYMQTHIWTPLSMTTTSFRPDTLRPDIQSALLPLHERTTDPPPTNLRPNTTFNRYPVPYDAGGGGLYSKPTDYMKLLVAILKKDPVLLGAGSYRLMFEPQIAETKWLEKFIKSEPEELQRMTRGGLPEGAKVSWGFGGLLSLEDAGVGCRRKGSLSWSGLPNLYWWIDPASGVCGHFATQVLPAGDGLANEMYSAFEAGVYRDHVNKKTAQL